MGKHRLGYSIGIVRKAGRNKFVVTVQLNYLVYVETNTQKYSFLYPH
jgi:hypothetical protein